MQLQKMMEELNSLNETYLFITKKWKCDPHGGAKGKVGTKAVNRRDVEPAASVAEKKRTLFELHKTFFNGKTKRNWQSAPENVLFKL